MEQQQRRKRRAVHVYTQSLSALILLLAPGNVGAAQSVPRSKIVVQHPNCLDYQTCVIDGKAAIIGSDSYAQTFVETNSGECIPILLSDAHRARLQSWSGTDVTVTGAVLVRLAEGDQGTLSIQYFDRNLAAGTCPQARHVIYVQKLSKRR
jgi:hypothetical protein